MLTLLLLLPMINMQCKIMETAALLLMAQESGIPATLKHRMAGRGLQRHLLKQSHPEPVAKDHAEVALEYLSNVGGLNNPSVQFVPVSIHIHSEKWVLMFR